MPREQSDLSGNVTSTELNSPSQATNHLLEITDAVTDELGRSVELRSVSTTDGRTLVGIELTTILAELGLDVLNDGLDSRCATKAHTNARGVCLCNRALPARRSTWPLSPALKAVGRSASERYLNDTVSKCRRKTSERTRQKIRHKMCSKNHMGLTKLDRISRDQTVTYQIW